MSAHLTRAMVLAAVLMAVALPATAAVTIKNSASYVGGGRWDWTLFVDSDVETLRQIQCVQYTLHPSFPNPVQTVCDQPQTKFGLTASGWGTFVVNVDVRYRDGRIERGQHRLVLEQSNAAPAARVVARNWSKQIEPGWWEWGVFVDGPAEQLSQIRCVEYTLHRTFVNPVRVVCSRGDKFLLRERGWGTFVVPIKLIMEDGSVGQMQHQLVLQ